MKVSNIIGIFCVIACVLVFFRPVFTSDKIPAPTDVLVNLFNPYRDYFSKTYPRGVPFKNPLVGDPVLQQIPFKKLSIDLLKKGELPLWNPYQMAGYPLLANIQSASFYPLNFIFFLLPFIPAWTIFIMLQQILGGVFMYLYLRNKSLSVESSVFGGIGFCFSGFFIAWLEWGNIAQTALWIPLGLLLIDKITSLKAKGYWYLAFGLTVLSSFLAGHLQTFIYSFLLWAIYFFSQWSKNRDKKSVFFTLLTLLAVGLLVFPIWSTQLNLIFLSARNVDISWQKIGFFIPLAQVIQFFAPDFFGNPATGNYWGVFNYGEFIGYIGMAPLIFAALALYLKRGKEVFLWGGLIVICVILATDNPLAKIPYKVGIPFFSSAQPTRLLILVEVGLSILAGLGYEAVRSAGKKVIRPILLLFVSMLVLIYGFAILSSLNFDPVHFAVTKRNLIVPSGLFTLTFTLLILSQFLQEKLKKYLLIAILGLTFLDLQFFAAKYMPFASKDYFYPTTKSLAYLIKHTGNSRIMTTTRQILSPNITMMYRLQSIDGYDPLYLMRFGELMAASERGKADISTPFGFNRIVIANRFNSRIIDLMGVKYVLSLTERSDPKLVKVFEEGETKIYENKSAFPRSFFVEKIIKAKTAQQSINFLFDPSVNLLQAAIVEDGSSLPPNYTTGSALITKYTPNVVTISAKNNGQGFLVLTDTFYPTWQVYIDGRQSKIYRTDFNFRGVIVPPGSHTVEFKDRLI